MRVLLLALFVINLAVYLWGRSGEGYSSLSDQGRPAGESMGNLTLLSEVGSDDVAPADGLALTDDEAAADELEAGGGAVLADEVCWVLGPFDNEEAVEVTDERLAVSWMRERYERDVDYWVLLGPYGGQAPASSMLQELKKQRIDSYLIRRGEMENAISLGVFSDESRAERHASTMRSRGYAVEVRRVADEAIRLWLVYRGADQGGDFDASMAFMESNKSNSAELSKKSCELIASYQEFD